MSEDPVEIVDVIIHDLTPSKLPVKHDLTVRYPFDQDRMMEALQSGDILRFKLEDWRAIVVGDVVAFHHATDRLRCLACDGHMLAAKDVWKRGFEQHTIKRVSISA